MRPQAVVLCLLVTAIAPTAGADEADPALVLGTGYITETTPFTHQGFGDRSLTFDYVELYFFPETTPSDGNSSAGFWVPVNDGAVLSTHTHPDETAVGEPPAYDLSVSLYGTIIDDNGGGWTDEQEGFITTCGNDSIGDVSNCIAHVEQERYGDYTITYTVTHAYVAAHVGPTPGAGLNVALTADPGPLDELDQLDQWLDDLALTPPPPGPRTQTGVLTIGHYGVELGKAVLNATGTLQTPYCPHRLDGIQQGTGFHLTSNLGGPFNVRFYDVDFMITYVMEFTGSGDDWGNVPGFASYGCIEMEDWLTPIGEFAYTDGLPPRADGDHSDRRFYSYWN